jgi:hypothetical protein
MKTLIKRFAFVVVTSIALVSHAQDTRLLDAAVAGDIKLAAELIKEVYRSAKPVRTGVSPSMSQLLLETRSWLNCLSRMVRISTHVQIQESPPCT